MANVSFNRRYDINMVLLRKMFLRNSTFIQHYLYIEPLLRKYKVEKLQSKNLHYKIFSLLS
jgi:hypothetical protein